MLYFPLFNYAHGSFDAIHEIMRHPQTGLGLADGGAHCGAICDASMPTFMLDPLGARPDAAASGSRSSTWCGARPATPPSTTACATAASSRPA